MSIQLLAIVLSEVRCWVMLGIISEYLTQESTDVIGFEDRHFERGVHLQSMCANAQLFHHSPSVDFIQIMVMFLKG